MNDWIRTWGLRLLALGIAIGIWFNASVEDRLASSEKVVEANVSYIRRPELMIINQVRNVNVRLIGSKRAIRQLNPVMVDVQVDLSNQGPGATTFTLGPENVLAPEGLEVVSIEPSTIRVDLEREVSLRLPVQPMLVGKPAAGVIVEEPEVFPNQVLVTGPDSMLSRIGSLATRPIRLDGHSTTFEETVPVVAPDPLIQIAQPSQVTVRVPLRQPAEPKTGKEKT